MSNQKHSRGRLIIIGGHEDKDHGEEILREVANGIPARKPLILMPVASTLPDELVRDYRKAFKKVGVSNMEVVDIRTREDAYNDENINTLKRAGAVFFTGGDQLRITSQLGDSPVFRCLMELSKAGVTIVGTSAGAAALPETMLISGPADESAHVSALGMAPGLGLIERVVIDTHFAERGRMGRLIGVVSENPANLGIGIDENTAIVLENNHFRVIGESAVYVVDGSEINYSSLSQKSADGVVSVFNVKVHVLGKDDRFDLIERTPVSFEAEKTVEADGKG